MRSAWTLSPTGGRLRLTGCAFGSVVCLAFGLSGPVVAGTPSGVCSNCKGKDLAQKTCKTCTGMGRAKCAVCTLGIIGTSLRCPYCKGTGWKQCEACKGTRKQRPCTVCGNQETTPTTERQAAKTVTLPTTRPAGQTSASPDRTADRPPLQVSTPLRVVRTTDADMKKPGFASPTTRPAAKTAAVPVGRVLRAPSVPRIALHPQRANDTSYSDRMATRQTYSPRKWSISRSHTTSYRPKTVYVKSYYRKDGTRVRAHTRSRPRHR
jgi:hypothetical protein